MHTDHLGPFLDALGSLFWLEITNKRWHANIAVGLKWLNEELGRYHQATPNLGKVKLVASQIRANDPGYPHLKVKAAQSKHLIAFGLALAVRHARGDATRPPFAFPTNGPHAESSEEYRTLVVECFSHLNAYVRAGDDEPFNKATCKGAIYGFLNAFDGLHVLFRRGVPEENHAKLPWHLRPKCHLMQHEAEDQLGRWGPPRTAWCYKDESFMGAVKNIAAKSTHPRTLETVVLLKTQLLVGIEALQMAR